MLLDLVEWFGASPDTARHVFIRSAAAAVTAFLVGVLLGPWLLRLLRRLNLGERTDKSDSEKLAELHAKKKETPTMGGLLLLPSLLVSLLLWGNFENQYVQLAFLGTIGFCFIGLIDDYVKLRYAERRGITSLTKLSLQTLVSGALALALYLMVKDVRAPDGAGSNPLLAVAVPFLGLSLDLSGAFGILFLGFAVFVMVGTSNSVNLADGMDGLAPGLMVIATLAFAAIAFAVGRPDYAEYLSVLHVRGAQEMVVVSSSLAGACVAFLWFNAFPAQVFLGDTGSLPLGGLLGYIALVTKQELVLPIVGFVFMAESLSVILQVGSYKLRRKRIFRCAPIHHHFQFAGIHEVKVVVRFWIVGGFCALLGLATLKFQG